MKVEVCHCQGCGYTYKMPAIELFKGDLGTFDLASWTWCTVECLLDDMGEYKKPGIGIVAKIKRPFFRWLEFHKYSKIARNTQSSESGE